MVAAVSQLFLRTVRGDLELSSAIALVPSNCQNAAFTS